MITANTEQMTELVPVGGGMAFPNRVNIEVVNEIDLQFDLSFELEYSEALRRYWVKKLNVTARSDEAEVTMRNINKMALQEFVTQGLSQLAVFDVKQKAFTDIPAMNYFPLKGEPWETLDWMLYIPYRVAEVLNAKPTQHMATMNETNYATAADQLGRSRKRGEFQKFDDVSEDIKLLQLISRPYKGSPVIHGNR